MSTFLSIEFLDSDSHSRRYPFPWTDSVLNMPFGFNNRESNHDFLQARYSEITSFYLKYTLTEMSYDLDEFDTSLAVFPKLKFFQLQCSNKISLERLLHILAQLPETLESLTLEEWSWYELSPEEALQLFKLIHTGCPHLTSLTLPETMYDAFYKGLRALPEELNDQQVNEEEFQKALKEHLPKKLRHMGVFNEVCSPTQHSVLLEHVMKVLPLCSLGLNPDSIPGNPEDKVRVLQGFIANDHLSALQLTSSLRLQAKQWLDVFDSLKGRFLESIDLSDNWSYRRFNANQWCQLFENLRYVGTLNLSGVFEKEESLTEALGHIFQVRSLILQNSGLVKFTSTLIHSFNKINGLECIDLSKNVLTSPQSEDRILLIQLLNRYHVTLDIVSFQRLFSLSSVSELDDLLNRIECSASMTLGGNYLRSSQIRGVLIRMLMNSMIHNLKTSWPETLHKKIDALLKVFEQLPSADKLRESYTAHFAELKLSAQNRFFPAATDFFQKFENYLSQLSLCEGGYEINRKRCESNAEEKNEEMTVDSSLPSP